MVEAQAYNAVHYTALPSCKQSCCCSCNRLVGPYKKEALIHTAPLSTDSDTHTHSLKKHEYGSHQTKRTAEIRACCMLG